MSLEEFLGRKYELESSEGFDDYMKALDVNGVLRKVANKLHSSTKLTKSADGKQYILMSALPFKKIKLAFIPGVEFDQETPDGREVKTIITIDGATLHEVQTDENGKITTLDRMFSKDHIEVVLKVDNVVATRRYKIMPAKERY